MQWRSTSTRDQMRAAARLVQVIAELRIAAGDGGIDGEEAVAVAARAHHRISEDRDRRFQRGHMHVPGGPMPRPIGRAGIGAAASHLAMCRLGAGLQPHQILRRLGGPPVLDIRIGDIDGGGDRDLGAERHEILYQLEVVHIHRQARIDMGIADGHHLLGIEGIAELDQPLHGDLLGLALSPVQHLLLVAGQLHLRLLWALQRNAIIAAASAPCPSRRPWHRSSRRWRGPPAPSPGTGTAPAPPDYGGRDGGP